MYLHVESNTIDFKDIIGIFSIDLIKESNINRKIIQKVGNNSKTLIVTTKNENDTSYYLSNVSTSTIYKRINKGE